MIKEWAEKTQNVVKDNFEETMTYKAHWDNRILMLFKAWLQAWIIHSYSTDHVIKGTALRCPSHNAFKCTGECGFDDCNTHFMEQEALQEHINRGREKKFSLTWSCSQVLFITPIIWPILPSSDLLGYTCMHVLTCNPFVLFLLKYKTCEHLKKWIVLLQL